VPGWEGLKKGQAFVRDKGLAHEAHKKKKKKIVKKILFEKDFLSFPQKNRYLEPKRKVLST